MTEPESTLDRPHEARPRRARWQLGLRVVFWLVAATAVWLTVGINRSEIASLKARIDRARPIARDLIVADPARIAAVKLDELWYGELRWDVYLPPGPYRLCLATRGIDETGLPPPSVVVPIAAGRHRLALVESAGASGPRIDIVGDGTTLLTAEEAGDWAGVGWSSREGVSASKQWDLDKPVVFLRLRMHRSDSGGRSSSAPAGPTAGLMVWIEATDGPRPVPTQ